MCRVIRRALKAGLVLTLLLAVAAASAAAPDGPRLAFARLDVKPLRLELLTVDPTGVLPLRLAGGGRGSGPLPYPFALPAWSPDGSRIAFTSVSGQREGPPRFRVFVVGADGSGLRAVPGTKGGYGPVFSSDGHTVAFARFRQRERRVPDRGVVTVYKSASVWIADVDRGGPRRLTRWRNGLTQLPSSFSPDGSALAITRVDEARTQEPEAVLFHFATGRIDLLAENGAYPTFSPDGSRIALSRRYLRRLRGQRHGGVEETTDLYTLDIRDFHLQRLTATPNEVEVFPNWNASGERLAYAQLLGGESEAAALGMGGAILQINADGTCRTRILSARRSAVVGGAWQPGLGREAGRIDC